ncbi:MAG TPA: ATP-binding SpoIIE family protein phosphatase [Gemmatimonadales bacterium]|nr:ATP-binding SpoIIE family protein phosphatase [Gemmatimonadales bacterium]
MREASEVGTARRAVVTLAERLGSSEPVSGKVALIVTELATNLVRHGRGGELLVRAMPDPGNWLEIVAVDRGPGMASVDAALRDGYSTGGSNGTGLGAIRRIADRCDIYSALGGGTVVLTRVALGKSAAPSARVVSGISVAKAGETVCGDAWAWASFPDRWSVLVADGLGHGPSAALASAEAVRMFREHAAADPADVIGFAHDALRHTRGAALGLAEVWPGRGQVTFTGVGNIGGTVITGGVGRNLVSHAGIVGHQCRKVQPFTYPWSKESVLVLYSDGLQTRWTLDKYPALAARDPALLAAVLYRDFSRGTDDITVVAGREASA